jgi:polar amino acid transport system permease protein
MTWSLFANNLPYLLVGAFPQGPLGGAALTLVLALCSALASAVLGVAGGIALAMAGRIARVPLLLVIGFFRAIPVLMLIFWTYFLLPVVFHVDVPGLATVVCALSLIGGAYLAHSVHAGIRAVGDGQWQAGLSLGLTRMQTLRYVLLPQAMRIMAPSFVNQWVSLAPDGVPRADLPVRRLHLPGAVHGARPRRHLCADAAQAHRATACTGRRRGIVWRLTG